MPARDDSMVHYNHPNQPEGVGELNQRSPSVMSGRDNVSFNANTDDVHIKMRTGQFQNGDGPERTEVVIRTPREEEDAQPPSLFRKVKRFFIPYKTQRIMYPGNRQSIKTGMQLGHVVLPEEPIESICPRLFDKFINYVLKPLLIAGHIGLLVWFHTDEAVNQFFNIFGIAMGAVALLVWFLVTGIMPRLGKNASHYHQYILICIGEIVYYPIIVCHVASYVLEKHYKKHDVRAMSSMIAFSVGILFLLVDYIRRLGLLIKVNGILHRKLRDLKTDVKTCACCFRGGIMWGYFANLLGNMANCAMMLVLLWIRIVDENDPKLAKGEKDFSFSSKTVFAIMITIALPVISNVVFLMHNIPVITKFWLGMSAVFAKMPAAELESWKANKPDYRPILQHTQENAQFYIERSDDWGGLTCLHKMTFGLLFPLVIILYIVVLGLVFVFFNYLIPPGTVANAITNVLAVMVFGFNIQAFFFFTMFLLFLVLMSASWLITCCRGR